MGCGECEGYDPETGQRHVDHGFREPDVRARYIATDGDDNCHTVTVTLKRMYGPCPCGSGEYDFIGTEWVIIWGGGLSLTVPDGSNCELIIKGLFPAHTITEEDIYDGERELWRMENGYYD